MIVADTNLVVALVLNTDRWQTAHAVFMHDQIWHAPAIWIHEFRNVLATHLRTGKLDAARAIRGLHRAHRVIPAVRTHSMSDDAILKLAIGSGCTAYDCEFAALAQAFGTPIVTWDRQLLRAFPEAAVEPEVFVLREAQS